MSTHSFCFLWRYKRKYEKYYLDNSYLRAVYVKKATRSNKHMEKLPSGHTTLKQRRFNVLTRTTALERLVVIKALTALVGRLSMSVGWKNGPERGLTIASFNPKLPVI